MKAILQKMRVQETNDIKGELYGEKKYYERWI